MKYLKKKTWWEKITEYAKKLKTGKISLINILCLLRYIWRFQILCDVNQTSFITVELFVFGDHMVPDIRFSLALLRVLAFGLERHVENHYIPFRFVLLLHIFLKTLHSGIFLLNLRSYIKNYASIKIKLNVSLASKLNLESTSVPDT